MGEILSFKQWICKMYKDDSSYLGDLAKDIAADDQFPDSGSMDDLITYIEAQGASESAVGVLLEAFNIFSQDS
ncbi:MAG: YozE family protein [Eubacterium sp.]